MFLCVQVKKKAFKVIVIMLQFYFVYRTATTVDNDHSLLHYAELWCNSISGVTRVGVNRGGNWKTDAFFSHHRLSGLQCRRCFFLINWRPFFAHHCHFYAFYSGVTPWRVSSRTFFYLPPLIGPLFFVNSATKKIFPLGAARLQSVIRAVRPSPP